MAKKKKSFREFLKGLELEDDTVDTIMAEFGAQTTANLERITELEGQISGSADLQTQLKTLHTQYDNDTKALKLANTKNSAIFRKFAGLGKAADLLMAKVDLDKIIVDDDGKITGGLDDQYESLTNEYKDILGSGSGSGDGGLPNGTTPPAGKNPEEMTMEEYIAYRSKL